MEEVEELAANIQMVSLLIEHRLRDLTSQFRWSIGSRLARDGATIVLPQEKTTGSAKHLTDHCRAVLSGLCSGALLPTVDVA